MKNEGLLNEIVDEEKDINEEMFRNDFNYQTPTSLVTDFLKQIKIKKIQLNI